MFTLMILVIPPAIPDVSHLPIPQPKIDQLQSITEQIINLLHLDGNEKKDNILNDLFQYGQSSLKTYKDYIIPDVYTSVMNNDENELIKQLKIYFEEQWKRQYQSSNELFTRILNEIKSHNHQDMYEKVLVRTARYGQKYMKNCTILSISLQMFFQEITDECLEDTTIFDELWYTITTDGIQLIRQYSEYITEDLMNKQITNKQSILFQSLREYYRQELIPFFQQCDIRDQLNLYGVALDHLAESGWKTGLQAISSKIVPVTLPILLGKVDIYLEEQSN